MKTIAGSLKRAGMPMPENPKTIKNATGLWVEVGPEVGPKKWKIKRIDNWPLLKRKLEKARKTLEDVQYKASGKTREHERTIPPQLHFDNLEKRYPGQGWKEKGEENELRRFARSIQKSFHKLEEQTRKEAEEQGQSI